MVGTQLPLPPPLLLLLLLLILLLLQVAVSTGWGSSGSWSLCTVPATQKPCNVGGTRQQCSYKVPPPPPPCVAKGTCVIACVGAWGKWRYIRILTVHSLSNFCY